MVSKASNMIMEQLNKDQLKKSVTSFFAKSKEKFLWSMGKD
jgi:hypothetical protein